MVTELTVLETNDALPDEDKFSFKVTVKAPAGHIHKHLFKVQVRDDDE